MKNTKNFLVGLMFVFGAVCNTYADDADLIRKAEEIYEATRITCSGISDEISKVSNISKANTAVTAVGTVASTGALVAGIKKSEEEKEIEALIDKICAVGGCTPEGVKKMSDADFFNNVLMPMADIAELQKKINKSKTLGNWRTGLMAGTIGTNLASAIMSGLNIKQSDLIQHITACNTMVESLQDLDIEMRKAGIDPREAQVMNKINSAKTWCNKLSTKDVEKIENRMKGVLGTSVVGGAIGIVGTATSAVANSDKYMKLENKMNLTEDQKKTEHALNTTANVMAGANIATGIVETGLNISLITLTKKLMQQAERCEENLK